MGLEVRLREDNALESETDKGIGSEWTLLRAEETGRAVDCDVTIGRAAYEACSATWNLGTYSAFALGSRKTTESMARVDRSQDLPYAK
jgi:hypothetical protein